MTAKYQGGGISRNKNAVRHSAVNENIGFRFSLESVFCVYTITDNQ